MTVTFEPDPERVKMNQYIKDLGQRWFSSKVIVQKYRHTHKHTDTLPTALPGQLKWLVNIQRGSHSGADMCLSGFSSSKESA